MTEKNIFNQRTSALKQGEHCHSKEDSDRETVSDSFRKNEGMLKTFISRFMYRPQDVDDIAQETFIRAFKAEKKGVIEHPKAYLYSVARNLALKELTKKSTKMTSFIEDSCSPEVLGSDENVEKQVGALEKLERVKIAIAELPPQCQRVFIMRKVYGFSHKEISQELGISVSTVEKHIVSGLKRCRQSVKRQETPRNIVPHKLDLSVLRKESE